MSEIDNLVKATHKMTISLTDGTKLILYFKDRASAQEFVHRMNFPSYKSRGELIPITKDMHRLALLNPDQVVSIISEIYSGEDLPRFDVLRVIRPNENPGE